MVIDGAPVRTYRPAIILDGRTYAPVHPFLTSAAERISRNGNVLVVQRDGRSVRLHAGGYVPIAPVLRALGASVLYVNHQVVVRFHRTAVSVPTPFDAAVPQISPRAIFTPIAPETPRPVWSGSPLPRRTPIPVTVPTPAR